MDNMRFNIHTIDDRASRKLPHSRFAALPFHVAKGFHPDVMVSGTLHRNTVVSTPLPEISVSLGSFSESLLRKFPWPPENLSPLDNVQAPVWRLVSTNQRL
jgi:hypothetical protein